MKPLYRFFIRIGSQTASAYEAHPVWKDDLAVEYTRESGQWFHRAHLSGSLDFIRGDYEYIMAESFGTVYYFDIQISDNGTSWSNYWRGKFTLTDCKINKDDKRITVKPEVVDQYTDILAGLEREFDLIKLAPVVDKVVLKKRPCLQIYDTASETVTCVMSNISFEQEASLPDENASVYLRQRCHFYPIRNEVTLHFTDISAGYEQDFADNFTGSITGDGSTLTNSADTFYIEYFEENLIGVIKNGLLIKSRATDQTFWKFEQEQFGFPMDLPVEVVFEPEWSGVGQMKATCVDHGLYSRIVCNTTTIMQQVTLELPQDDILPYNRNYKRAFPYNCGGYIITSTRKTSTPTQWGKDGYGYYYLPPDDVYEYIPIGRTLWEDNSIWYRKNNDYEQYEESGTHRFWLKDAYPISSCIWNLLHEIAPDISFSDTSTYSQFLFSGSDPIQGRNNALYLTPKSNITNGEYQTPAQTAPVTLKQIFDMLANTYRCYWFIDSSNRLRIEHVWFFMNGGDYQYSPTVGIDLTTMVNKRNGKYWDYGTNEYDYEKMEMPERYQFAWMDEVTDFFKGQPIEVVSAFVEKGKIEEINVGNFTSDIDYMMLNPSAVSPDGFALLNVIPGLLGREVPIVTFYYYGYSMKAQNAYLSFHMLQWAYWPYNVPSKFIKIEGDQLSPNNVFVAKGKRQTVNVPLGIGDPEMLRLVKTGLGNGMIEQASIRLTTRMAKLQLRFDTETVISQ